MARFAAIGLLAGASVAYEILLTRLFSILLWHHFAYMIISVALLGIGASGTVLAFAQGALAPRFTVIFAGCAVLFAILSVGGFALAQRVAFDPLEIIWDTDQHVRLAQIYLLLALPFCAAGTGIGLAFIRFDNEIAAIYCADLIGAGLGALLIVALLYLLAPGDCLRVLGGLGFLAAALAASAGGARPTAALALLAVIAALAWPTSWLTPRPSPYKGLSLALTAPGTRILAERSSPLGLLTVVESPVIPFRHAPGLSLASPSEPPPQLGAFTDADALSVITRFTGDMGLLGYLDQQTMALPYHLLEHPRTLILGAGGGADVLRALYHHASHVDAVELNPDLIDLVRRDFAEFAGRIYDRQDVTVHLTEARSFAQASKGSWDLIQVALLDSFTAAAAGVQALGETPLYTVEALQAYHSHLRPSGMLAITRWLRSPPSDPIKLFATAIQALEQAGVSSPGDRLAMVHDWSTVTLLVKKAPFDRAEIARIRAFAESRSFDVAWFPGIQEADANRFNRLEEPSLFRAASALLGPEREQFLRTYKFHVRPATDDRPYFFRFLKFELLPELFALRGQGGLAQADTGYLVVLAALVQSGFASLVLILLPLAALRPQVTDTGPALPKPARRDPMAGGIYFLALGFGFMFIEISFIHRFTTFLGHPTAAIAVVLAAFLIFAGLGSGMAGELEQRRRPAGIAVAAIVLFAGTYLLALPGWLPELMAWPFLAKVGVTLLLIAPLGVAMGMPFPLGLTRVAAQSPGLVPWAWGINGCASVVGAVLASFLAMQVGFTVLVCLALVLYAMAVLTFDAGWPDSVVLSTRRVGGARAEAPNGAGGEPKRAKAAK